MTVPSIRSTYMPIWSLRCFGPCQQLSFAVVGESVCETTATVPAKPRLLDEVRQAIRARHYSRRTEQSYLAWIKRFIVFHGIRHPKEMREPEITAFLSGLAVRNKVSASTQNQALCAIPFLYREVLKIDLCRLEDVVRARVPRCVPVVLTRGEVGLVLEQLRGTARLMSTLLYGSGLRLLECARLRIKDVDFATNQITVRGRKGNKGRVTLLPESVRKAPASHIERVRSAQEGPGGGRRLG